MSDSNGCFQCPISPEDDIEQTNAEHRDQDSGTCPSSTIPIVWFLLKWLFMVECPLQIEMTNFIVNYKRNQNDPYYNTYNIGRRNHPNFGWEGNQAGGKKCKLKLRHYRDLMLKHKIRCTHLLRRSFQRKKCSCSLWRFGSNKYKANNLPSET